MRRANANKESHLDDEFDELLNDSRSSGNSGLPSARSTHLPSGDTNVDTTIDSLNTQNDCYNRAIGVVFMLLLLVLLSTSEKASSIAATVLSAANNATGTFSKESPTEPSANVEPIPSPIPLALISSTITNAPVMSKAATLAPVSATLAPVSATSAPVSATSATVPATAVTTEQCTADQLKKIETQIPTNNNCFGAQYTNQCPITIETDCPDPSWLNEYYASNNDGNAFVAIDVGCGTALNAIKILRMGTNDDTIDIPTWEKAITDFGGGLYCSNYQMPNAAGKIKREGTVHCIEPLPITFDAVSKAIVDTKYNEKGLKMYQLSITDKQGWHDFPLVDTGSGYHQKVSVAQKDAGPGACSHLDEASRKEKCKPVEETTLDAFAEKNLPGTGNINILLSEAAAFDFEVLMGGKTALKRVEYVEFGFNWKGTWTDAGKTLTSAVQMLNELGFTCYWAGKKKLWRITGCLRPEYDTAKFWSHIACANRNLAPTLVGEMEKLFLATIN